MSDLFPVKPDIAAHARVRSVDEYRRRYRESLEDPTRFWSAVGERVTWFHPPQQTFDADLAEVDFAWYSGGRLNVCHNCVDRHLPTRASQVALIWVGNDPGTYRRITFAELKHHVARVANVLKAQG